MPEITTDQERTDDKAKDKPVHIEPRCPICGRTRMEAAMVESTRCGHCRM